MSSVKREVTVRSAGDGVGQRTPSLSRLDFHVCAQSLVDSVKTTVGWDVRANAMAGRLWHQLMETRCVPSLRQYLVAFANTLSSPVYDFIKKHADALEDLLCKYKQSSAYDDLLNAGYLSAVRLYDTYVLRTEGPNPVYESVTQMFLRVSVFVTCQCLANECLFRVLRDLVPEPENFGTLSIVEYVFSYLASQHVCCATPVMRAAGVREGQLASCFILKPSMADEAHTLRALYHEMSPLLASKSGVGLDVTTFSKPKNVASCLKLVDAQVKFFNDSNIRPVGTSVYMELWHSQICEFLSAKLPENPDRCHNLFQGVCVPSLFFRLYENDPDATWYLFDPVDAPELVNLYGSAFDDAYWSLVRRGKHSGSMSLKSMMFNLINTIIKTGSPFVLLKEALNVHHWTETQGEAINCSNLCAEIVQAPKGNASVCNLANICLPKCIRAHGCANAGLVGTDKLSFCFELLGDAVRAAVVITNACILGGFHPTPGVRVGQQERSLGIGVQGLADVFAELGYGYMDEESARLDRDIFQWMYYTAVEMSHSIVVEGKGTPFKGWETSNFAKGRFHWQTWEGEDAPFVPSHRWESLGQSIAKHGIFNSQFLAMMPTAGTSQLTGYSESVYPFFANVSSRVTNKEEILRPNVSFFKRVLPEDLNLVRQYGGNVIDFPVPLRDRYWNFLSAFDYCPFQQLDRARARAPFIDQSQSLSYFLKEDNVKNASYLRDLLLHGYRLGLKTIMYYCRIQKQSSLAALQCLMAPGSPTHTGTLSNGAEPECVQNTGLLQNEPEDACLACQ
ncbi:ORF61 [Retroperitoneal fibromatosis-associated herpesvirus]|uniref:Ribonucleoside-diphosphate reductase large subunit n=1 Tax=Retroperitoneal fibromatosis-associated herpesvirus TaxID=111469 RepID=U5NM39_9GAMA|nr:ORF61 [Retroperitoneal fibromatosis-associated herpesvirus]AGY30747.1 ORF61 [Retroperitoneal fibromatosis-associated herpesvirus]